MIFQGRKLRVSEVGDRDRLQVGHLQSASLLFALVEARDRWAPVEEFTTSPLFAQEMEVTTKTVYNQSVSCKHLKGIIMARTKRGEKKKT